eukprot:5502177-Prymnesium_polylepis.1
MTTLSALSPQSAESAGLVQLYGRPTYSESCLRREPNPRCHVCLASGSHSHSSLVTVEVTRRGAWRPPGVVAMPRRITTHTVGLSS